MSIQKSFLIIVSALIVLVSGCATEIEFQKSTHVPAATIKASVELDKNENYAVDLEVANLALPTALTPAKQTYVVWVNSDYGNINVGQMLINKNLKGKLSFVTAYKPISVFITAEDEADVIDHGGHIILESKSISVN